MTFGNPPKRVAEYILQLAREYQNPLTPMQVLKLAYIAHGWQLGLYGRPLVNGRVEAWPYGPVIPPIYRAYKKYGGSFIRDFPEETIKLESEEQNTLAQVWKGYGHWSGPALSTLTHEGGSPWDITVKQSGMGAVISDDLIESYYRRLAAK